MTHDGTILYLASSINEPMVIFSGLRVENNEFINLTHHSAWRTSGGFSADANANKHSLLLSEDDTHVFTFTRGENNGEN